jgi:hypothetical protein
MPYTQSQGIRIHYHIEGEGPPLVLHHGFTDSLESWYELGYVEARACTCPLRINTTGALVNYYRDKKVYTRGLSWHPSRPFTPRDALKASRADTRLRVSSPPSVAPSPALSSLHLRWLWPRWHAEEQHLAQRPDVIRQSRRHRWRARPPLLGRTRAVGGLRLGQGLA